VTGWSADYILRRLPVALGLQMILWHDQRAGRVMRWSQPMREHESVAAVDIVAEMQQTLANATHDAD
jgi:hypothetical protein